MIAFAPAARAGWFSWPKALLCAGVALYLFLAALVLSHTSTPLAGAHALVPLAIALLPLCAFATFRYPLIFPFGLYVLIAPIDAVLSASGAAPLVKLIGAFAIAALALRIVLLRSMLLPRRTLWWWGAMVAYATLSIAWAPDFSNGPGSNTYVPMVLLFLMMAVLAIYPAEVREFKVMLGIVVLSGVVAGAYTLSQYHPGATSDATRVALKAIDNATIEDPNYLAGAFFLPLACALAGVFYARNWFVRIAAALAIPPMIGAVLTTASRSALLGIGAIVLYFAVRGRYRIGALLVAAASIAMMAFFPNMLARWSHADVGTADGRTDIWRTGMHNLGDHWLFGAGFGSYQYEYDRNVLQVFQSTFAGWTRPGHSLIFVALNDYGIVGLGLVLGCWFYGFRQMRTIAKDDWRYGVRLALEAAMIGLFLHMLFLDPTFVKYVWLTQSLPLLMLNLSARGVSGARVRPSLRGARSVFG